MKNRTKFYEILLNARDNNNTMMIIIEKIMPLIERYSQVENNKFNEELKNYLIEYAIKVIRDKNFAEKLRQK